MILTTTSALQGRNIDSYLGVVTGECIMGANVFRDMFAGIRDIVGGRAGSYEEVISRAKNEAMSEMMEQAKAMGANGIIGIDVDYETIGGSMLMVAVSGTAVLIR